MTRSDWSFVYSQSGERSETEARPCTYSRRESKEVEMSEDVVFLSLQNIIEAYFEHDLNKRRQSVSAARLAPVTALLVPLARGDRPVCLGV